MATDHRALLSSIKRFDQLIAYLRDEMGWPIDRTSFEELTFDYSADELGIDPKNAARIQEIKRLRPLTPSQPWGIFFVKFEPRRLPIVALRRILNQVVLKKRAGANPAERAVWNVGDLLFVSNYGEGEERTISFAHFSQPASKDELPTLKVLGWNNLDTPLHLDNVAHELINRLAWPVDESNVEKWREGWGSAFSLEHREVISTSRELSIHLARLARAIHDLIKEALGIETESGPLTRLLTAFREGLVHDLSPDEFADMYAQTVAYGLLSARISNQDSRTADDITTNMRTSPFLKELMETFLRAGGRGGRSGGIGVDFDELGVGNVVDLLDHAKMGAVLRDFGDRNPEEDPVIHFYELFLKEYDAKKRMQRGVFYTPRPVVSYIVRSVDEVLRTEFGLADGLADVTTWGEMAERHEDLKIPQGVPRGEPFVQILDPAAGTGTFLVEVIESIHRTLSGKWEAQHKTPKEIDELWNAYVPVHLLPRLHGYELLMAPYAIAHLKISLKLLERGYRFNAEERARVFLTNALEPVSDMGQQTLARMFSALAREARAVNEIKRSKRFTVVIGNPPYSKSSQNQGEWIESLMERFKTTIKSQEIQRQALSNDYVKFLCLGSTVLEPAECYVLGMITDNSYLDGPLFRDMRANLMESYRTIRVTDLGGNSRRMDATNADQNVFDIQQGVAILIGSTFGQTERHIYLAVVRGSREEKASWMAARTAGEAISAEIFPIPPQRYFLPSSTGTPTAWESWHPLPEIFAGGIRSGRPLPFNGAALATRQDSLAIAFTRAELRDNLRIFFDKSETHRSLDERFGLCSTSHFDFNRARSETTLAEAEACIRPILYRPFDTRYVVYHPLVIGEPRLEVMKHLLGGSLALLSTRRVTGKPYDNVFVCRGLVEYKAVTHDRNTQVFPLYLTRDQDDKSKFSTARGERRRTNIAPAIYEEWKHRLNVHSPEEVFYTIYALLFSEEYRRRFREALERDYARVPFPLYLALHLKLVEFGSALVSLHLMESPELDDFITTFTGPKDPQVERVGWSDDAIWLNVGATRGDRDARQGTVGFRGVPESVWTFHVGGYQVCEKWLKDRKGRRLSKDEISQFQRVVVAISKTLRIVFEIDQAIERAGGWPDAFQGTATKAQGGSHDTEFGGQLSFGKDGKLKGTASLENWKE
jgi:hypothetical protein